LQPDCNPAHLRRDQVLRDRDGLIAEASLDIEGSATAREAWRLVKSDSIGVSFGYVAEEVDGGDGTRLLISIDLYEISLTATPMHPDAKVVSWKSGDTDLGFRMPTDAEIRARMMEAEIAELAAKSAKSQRPIQVATSTADGRPTPTARRL
jgi:phage head maturation protease